MTLKKEFESYHKRQGLTTVIERKTQRQLKYAQRQGLLAPKIKKKTIIVTLYER